MDDITLSTGDYEMGVREELVEIYGEDLLFADGFDDAILGVSIGFDTGRVVYDTRKMMESLTKEGDCTEEEAWEYLEFNTFGSYVGEQTPVYIDTINDFQWVNTNE